MGSSRAFPAAARILRAYYRGTTVTTAPTRTVRVLLSDGRRSAAVSSPRAWRAIGATIDGRRVVRLRARAAHTIRVGRGGRLALLRGARRVALFTGQVRLVPAKRRGRFFFR